MDKNKGHIDAKEFFKLLDADANQTSGDLDEFDLEALEGLRMVKDPAKAHAKVDAGIDEILREPEENKKTIVVLGKDKPKTGLYIMSIAASLVLLFGLFFVFKTFDNKDAVADNRSKESTTEEATGAAPAPPALESQLQQTNSDEKIKQDKGPVGLAEQSVPREENNLKGQTGYYSYQTGFSANADSIKLELSKTNGGDVLDYESVRTETTLDDITVADNFKDKNAPAGELVVVEKEEKKAVKADSDYDAKNKVVAYDQSVKKQEEVPYKKRAVVKAKVAKKAESEDMTVASPVMEPKQAPVQTTNETTTTTTGSSTLSQSSTPTLSTNAIGGNTYSWTPANNSAGSGEATPVVSAEFVGGKTALDAYIKKNLIVPASCASEEVIIVKFTVDSKGLVSKPKIASKTGNCPDCEKEAIRFVKAMPAWVAATQNAKAVSSQKTLELSFKK